VTALEMMMMPFICSRESPLVVIHTL